MTPYDIDYDDDPDGIRDEPRPKKYRGCSECRGFGDHAPGCPEADPEDEVEEEEEEES